MPVIATSLAPMRRMVSSSRSSSPVSPRMRQGDDDIVALDRAEVAVHGLGRVQEERRRPGARERRGDLARDDAGLAHPGDDDAAAAVAQQVDGAGEPLVHAVDEGEDGGGFGPEHLAGEFEVGHGPQSRRRPRAGRVDAGQQLRAAPSSRSSARAFCASLFARDGSS